MTILSAIEISSMAYGGAGVAKVDGKVVFVMGAIEGDLVDARITTDKKSFAKAEVARILTPSPWRRPPPCDVSESCGGCPLMAANDDRQVLWKKDFALSSLAKQTGLSYSALAALAGDVVAAEPLGYRHRVTFKVAFQDGKLALGFLGRRSHTVVPTSTCVVATPAIQQALADIQRQLQELPIQRPASGPKSTLARKPGSKPGSYDLEVQEVLPATPDGPRLIVTLSPQQRFKGYPLDQLLRRAPELKPLAEAVRSCAGVAWFGAAKDSQHAPAFAFDRDEGGDYLTFPGSFQQAHLGINRHMRDVVKAALSDCESVLDLFCGSGNLSLALSDDPQRQVQGIEASAASIKAAKLALRTRGLRPKVSYKTALARKALAQPAAAETHAGKPPFDGIVSDPPRAGHGRLIAELIALKAKRLVLVGCDPMHLARDVNACLKAGYSLADLHIFDAFPQTTHVETIAVLRQAHRLKHST